MYHKASPAVLDESRSDQRPKSALYLDSPHVAAILILCLASYGCGNSPHADAPALRFIGATLNEAGVHVFESHPVVETKITLSDPEDRTVFVEILNNQQYQSGVTQGLVAGDDWGGQRQQSRSNSDGGAEFALNLRSIESSVGEQYWIRSGVLLGQRDFGILVSLVEMPIDKRGGILFETITVNGAAARVAYGVSSFVPFAVAPMDTKE